MKIVKKLGCVVPFVGLCLIFSTKKSIAVDTFDEPVQWSVGDLNTTYQKWSAEGPSSPILSVPREKTSNPLLSMDPVFGWSEEATIFGSGGLYSFGDNYTISAQIPGHSPANAEGTHIRVQMLASMMPDYDPEGDGSWGSVRRESIKIYDSNNVLAITSDSIDVVRTAYYPSYLAGFPGEEILWDVFVPDLVGDFHITAEVMLHCSFQALRVDSWVVVSQDLVPGDFNGDGNVDGIDFSAWQSNFPKSADASLGQGDADGDGDIDGADFVVWQTHFSPTSGSGVQPVPESNAILSSLIGIGSGLFVRALCRRRRRIKREA
jgi:hypothetical protein